MMDQDLQDLELIDLLNNSTNSRASTSRLRATSNGVGDDLKLPQLQKLKYLDAEGAFNSLQYHENASNGADDGISYQKHSYINSDRKILPFNQSTYFDDIQNDPENLAQAQRMKSLELRIKGMIKTIRNLEIQLNQSISAIVERDRMLSSAYGKIKALETKDRNRAAITTSNAAQAVRSKSRFDAQIASKYESQLELLESRVSEEQLRRQQAEDRCKAYKGILDKLKISNTECEGRSNSLQKLLDDSQQKLAGFKRDNKDLVLKAQSLQSNLSECTEVQQQHQLRAAKLEAALRAALEEMNALKEEAVHHRNEAVRAQNHSKVLLHQLSALKERLNTRQTEEKLRRVSQTNYSYTDLPDSQSQTQSQQDSVLNDNTSLIDDYAHPSQINNLHEKQQAQAKRIQRERILSMSFHHSDDRVVRDSAAKFHRSGSLSELDEPLNLVNLTKQLPSRNRHNDYTNGVGNNMNSSTQENFNTNKSNGINGELPPKVPRPSSSSRLSGSATATLQDRSLNTVRNTSSSSYRGGANYGEDNNNAISGSKTSRVRGKIRGSSFREEDISNRSQLSEHSLIGQLHQHRQLRHQQQMSDTSSLHEEPVRTSRRHSSTGKSTVPSQLHANTNLQLLAKSHLGSKSTEKAPAPRESRHQNVLASELSHRINLATLKDRDTKSTSRPMPTKYDKLRSMYKRVTGRDMSLLENDNDSDDS